MSLARSLGITLTALTLAALPLFVSAQSYNYNTSAHCGYSYPTNSDPYGYSYNGSVCGPRTLLVYVQVMNPSDTNATYAPSNFTVTVSGTNPTPSTFAGSIYGTPVQMGVGNYLVSIANAPAGFTASYSAGCSGSIDYLGQGPTCVVTETSSANQYSYPTPYPYPYTTLQPLTCTPSYQTVNIGQSVTFTVENGIQGTFVNGLPAQSGYNWQTPSRSFLNIGPTLTTLFQTSGVQTVTVSNGAQTAICTVNIVSTAQAVVYPGASSVTATYYPSSSVVPTLPNTGFEPHTALEYALALALLGAAAIASYPYVRKISFAILG